MSRIRPSSASNRTTAATRRCTNAMTPGWRSTDQVRRRVQNESLGHRGRKADPLFRIRKLLLTGSERLDERGTNRMLLGLRRR